MEFIDHSIAWCKGEIFEARFILGFGVLLIILAMVFYAQGMSPGSKAMLWPLLVVGAIFTTSGTSMIVSNNKRIKEYTVAFEQDAAAFISSEKARVEEFKSWYPAIRYVASGLAIAGLGCMLFWHVPIGRTIGIALILTALATFVIDFFSEERADLYYLHILATQQ